MAPCARCAALALLLPWLSALSVADAAESALHEQIDRLIESAAVGPLAAGCSDADFVRRVYLDLTGVIPTADQARAFVADTAPNKRERLIDALLAGPAFLRHMTVTLDVLLMERKPEKVIKQPEWDAYLYQSLADDKPLDRLVSELIASDGADEKHRAAARFVLDRDAEPNLLTRDIGRLVFGMDLQCSQCHDHPLVDDYFQDDYYGLFAFVQRTSLFTDAKTKQVSLTEKADGEASFKSVFTGTSSDKATPRLPKGALLLAEPVFAKGDEYRVKPEKTVRGVPKFSRRAALAERVGDSREFARNLANRLWAHMFGRGLVHPLDFHHADNPPSHPELLTLLADRLASEGYRLRPFLRELALSRMYGRSCEAPRAETVNFADVKARLSQLAADNMRLQQDILPLQDALAAAGKAFKAAQHVQVESASRLAKLQTELAANQKQLEKLAAEGKATVAAAVKVHEQAAAASRAADDLAKLVALLPDDSSLADAAAKVAGRTTELLAAARLIDDNVKKHALAEQAAAQRVQDAQQAIDLATASRPSTDHLVALESERLSAEHTLADARYGAKVLDARMEAAKAMLNYRELIASEPAKADAAWTALVEQWTIAGQVAALKPLAPEQLAASAMQATGMLAPQVAAVEQKLAKSPPEELKTATEANKAIIQSRLCELELLNQLQGTSREFVRLYGGDPGQDFQATANQALFFGNGTVVDGWLKPAGENLVLRLQAKSAQPDALAEELYWAVFSRPANDAERKQVAEYLAGRQNDKAAAIAEMTWALLGSTEFRFNH